MSSWHLLKRLITFRHHDKYELPFFRTGKNENTTHHCEMPDWENCCVEITILIGLYRQNMHRPNDKRAADWLSRWDCARICDTQVLENRDMKYEGKQEGRGRREGGRKEGRYKDRKRPAVDVWENEDANEYAQCSAGLSDISFPITLNPTWNIKHHIRSAWMICNRVVTK